MKIFAQENLGRPDLEVKGDLVKLEDFFQGHLPEDQVPPIQVVLVFTHPEVEVNISEEESPPAETVPLKKLKDTIRKSDKGKRLSMEKVDQVLNAIDGE